MCVIFGKWPTRIVAARTEVSTTSVNEQLTASSHTRPHPRSMRAIASVVMEEAPGVSEALGNIGTPRWPNKPRLSKREEKARNEPWEGTLFRYPVAAIASLTSLG